MAEEVILPRVDMDMTEGKIAHWYVQNGDAVKKGQILFEIETDKATMEIEATADGVLQGSDGAVGVMMPVGQVVAWIAQPGEKVASAEAAPAQEAPNSEQKADAMTSPAPDPSARAPVASNLKPASGADEAPQSGRPVNRAGASRPLRATPLARSTARLLGVDLRTVEGSGPQGRVLGRDLHTEAGAATASDKGAAQALHLHWFNRRQGTPLVLLHGFGTSSSSWRLLAEALGDLPILGIDLPNHGNSGRLAVNDFDAIARMLLARLDQEGLGEVHLAGHSMGGGAAIALSALLQQRLRSMTLLAPLGLGPQINGAFIQGILRATRQASLRPWLATLFGDPAKLTGSFAATAWSELQSAEDRAALSEMADRLLPDGTQAISLRAQLAEVHVPLKLLWGLLDRIVPSEHAAGIAGEVALHLLPGVGHLPQFEAPALVASLLRQQIAAGDSIAPARPVGVRSSGTRH
ncbi:MAG: acetoin dehydrogenase dihydrolipoyllysine-residue acetyltransferase subunit [Variovorax sp.]